MSSSRSDSLTARLKRARLFNEYFSWWLSERPSTAERLDWLTDKGIKTSYGAVHQLHRSSEASAWRIAEARKARALMEKNLPQDLDETIRKTLLDQRFSLVMGELTHKELMDQITIENENEKLKLKKEELALKKADLTKKNLLASLRLQLVKARDALQRITSEGLNETNKDGVAALLAEMEAIGVK